MEQFDEEETLYFNDGFVGIQGYAGTPSRSSVITRQQRYNDNAQGTGDIYPVRQSRNNTDEDTSDYTVHIPASKNPYATTQRASRPPVSRRQAEPGPRYPERDEYGNVRTPQQRQTASQRAVQRHQPEREYRVTTGGQRNTDQPKQGWQLIQISKKTGQTLITAGVAIGCLCAVPVVSMAYTGGSHIVHQYEQGATPSISVQGQFNHNNDSREKPTILRAMVSGDYIDFEEVPGGDISKTHGWQSPSIKDMGYTGDLRQVYLQITSEQVGDGKVQIRLTAIMGGVGPWPFVQPVVRYWIFTDNGKFFVGPTGK